MSLESYNRFAVRSFEISILMVIIGATLMWLATLADHFLALGWGWDPQIIWIAPVIVAGALLTRTLGRLIFRSVGASD